MSPAEAYLARLRGRGAEVQAGALRLALALLEKERLPHPAPLRGNVPPSTPVAFPWHLLEPSDVSALLAALLKQRAPATARRVMSAVRGTLRECWRAGLLDADKLARLLDTAPIRFRRERRGRALSVDEVERMLAVAGSPRERALVSLMAFTGLRRAEVAALRVADVGLLPDGNVTVRVASGKGDRARVVTLCGRAGEEAAAHARDLFELPLSAPLFGYSADQIRQVLARLSSAAGLGRVTPHDMRRTYATLALRAGADLLTVQATMGHVRPETTALYDCRGEDARRKLAEQLDFYRGRRGA